jgi:hypothetical protein
VVDVLRLIYSATLKAFGPQKFKVIILVMNPRERPRFALRLSLLVLTYCLLFASAPSASHVSQAGDGRRIHDGKCCV